MRFTRAVMIPVLRINGTFGRNFNKSFEPLFAAFCRWFLAYGFLWCMFYLWKWEVQRLEVQNLANLASAETLETAKAKEPFPRNKL